MPILSSPVTRLSKRASHIGRSQSSFTFHVSSITAVGGPLPSLYNCNGLTLRLWRNNKFFNTNEAMIVGDGNASWSGALDVPATLYTSKTNKVFSSKFFSVSLLARHGKRLREVARGEVDLASFVRDSEAVTSPQASTLQLSPRGDQKSGSPVILRWQVRAAKTEAEGNDDDDSYSRADSASTLASGTVVTAMSKVNTHGGESMAEQDLSGFEPTLEPIESTKELVGWDGPIAGAPAHDTLNRVSEGIENEEEETRRESVGGGAGAGAPTGGDAVAAPASSSAAAVGSDGTGVAVATAASEPRPPVESPPAPPPPSLKKGVDSAKAAGAADASGVVVHLGDVGGGGVLATGSGLAVASSVASAAASGRRADEGTASVGALLSAAPLKAGWLRKRAVSAPTMLKNWRLRYVVLSPRLRQVLWYKSADSSEPQGKLGLLDSEAAAEVAVSSSGPPRLTIRAGHRELLLEAEDQQTIEEWRQAVQAVLDSAQAEQPAASAPITDEAPKVAPSSCVLL